MHIAVSMPAPRRLVRDIAVHLAEAVLVPLGVFYLVMVTVGLRPALLAATGWALLAVVARLVRGQRPPALLVAGTLLALLRVGLTAMSGSAVVYFLQPTITTYLFAAALLVTVRLEQPLIQRLATDFCPLPDHVVRATPMRRLFQQLSLLWGAVLLGNASITLGMLLTMPTTQSVPLSSAASAPLFVVGLCASLAWFRRSMRRGGFVLAWGTASH